MFAISFIGDQVFSMNYIFACLKDFLRYAYHFEMRIRRLKKLVKVLKHFDEKCPDVRLKMDGFSHA